jgi:hypothetical protein
LFGGSTAPLLQGLMEGLVNYPVEYTKAQLQVGTRFASPLGVVSETVKQKGFFGLYRGFRPYSVMVCSAAAVRFYSFESARRGAEELGGLNENGAVAAAAVVC